MLGFAARHAKITAYSVRKRDVRRAAKDLKLVVNQNYPLTSHTPAKCPAILLPGKSFDDENRIFREQTSGSARTRWVSEYSEHRRPATRQRGICSPSLEQSVSNFLESRMTTEDRPLEIIRKACPLPAPAQSAEPPNFRGFRAFCQFRRNPLEGVFGAHSNIPRRHHHNRLLRRVRQRIDFISPVYRQRPSAKQKERHIRAQACRNLHQSRQR